MDRSWVFAAATDERRQIANLLDDLDEAQWAQPSLCSEWTVKVVAAHLVSTLSDGTPAFLWAAVRQRSVHRGVNELAQRRAQDPPSKIVADLRDCADLRMSPPGAGPLDPLTDVMVHAGDIRIALGLPFEPDKQRTALAVDFATGFWRFAFVSRQLLKGVRLRASDVDRAWGKGLEVRGPVAALMMTAAGRSALVDTLDGPGVPILRERLAR